MAIQSAVACSEAKDGGLLVSWQLMGCVLVWVVSSSLAVGDGFLFITDKSFDFSVWQIRRASFPLASCSAMSFLLCISMCGLCRKHHSWCAAFESSNSRPPGGSCCFESSSSRPTDCSCCFESSNSRTTEGFRCFESSNSRPTEGFLLF